MNPEYYSYLLPLLLERGAVDVYLTQIIMKKNRPGIILHVLCYESIKEEIEDIIFTETTTLGIRKTLVQRDVLERISITIPSCYGQLNIKVAMKEGKVLKYAPEYGECSKIASEYNIPIKEVYQKVTADAEKYINCSLKEVK